MSVRCSYNKTVVHMLNTNIHRIVMESVTITLVILASLMDSTSCSEDCVLENPIPFMTERVVGYVLGPNELAISDFYMNEGYYSMHGYTISANSSKGCGAPFHWYMNDTTLPAANETITKKVCFADGTNCSYSKEIRVKNCSSVDYRFYLYRTDASDEVYCIESLNGTNSGDPAPDVNYIKPVVDAQVIERQQYSFKLEFRCFIIVKPNDRSFFYTVEWSVTDTSGRVKHLRTSTAAKINDGLYNDTTQLTEDHLIGHGINKLGFNLSCSVRAKSSIAGRYSDVKTSDSAFFGIEISSGTDIRIQQRESVVIGLKLTAPFRCKHLSSTCTYDVFLFVPKSGEECTAQTIVSANKDLTKTCGVRFQMNEVGITKNITLKNMMGDNAFQRIGVEYNVVLQTNSLVGHKLHTGYTPDTIRMFTEVDYNKLSNTRCYAHSDPHTKSFDQSGTFENQAEGTFMLYRNLAYNVEVQTKHKACYRNNIFCNKAVAIRVGRDVYVIDIETGQTAFTLCDDAVLAGKVRRDTGKTFVVFLPTGARVEIKWSTFLEIDILPGIQDYDSTDGLCGKFDNNPNNDADKPAGCTAERHLCWKLEEKNSLFNRDYVNNLKGWSETLNLCACDCDYDKCRNVNDVINCSPQSQILCKIESYKEIGSAFCYTSRLKRDIHKRHAFEPDTKQSYNYERESLYRFRRETTVFDYKTAMQKCTEEMNTTSVQMCSNVPGLDSASYFQDCAMDLMLTNSYEWVQIHLEGLKQNCIRFVEIRQPLNEDVLKYVTIMEDNNATHANASQSSGVFTKQLLQDIKSVSCPNDCSNKGMCAFGNCQCNSGHIGFDCSLAANDPPEIIGIPDSGLCDLSERPCEQTMVVGRNFVESEKLTCRFVPLMINNGSVVRGQPQTIRGTLDTFMQVLCPFPRESRKRREDQQFDINTIALGYAISISNNADVFSVEDSIVIFDSMCLSCMKQNGSILCNNKPGYCAHQGRCFKNGDRHQCYTCTGSLTWNDNCDTNTNASDKRYWIIGAVLGPVIAIAIAAVVAYKLCSNNASAIEPNSPLPNDEQSVYTNGAYETVEHQLPRDQRGCDEYDVLRNDAGDERPASAMSRGRTLGTIELFEAL